VGWKCESQDQISEAFFNLLAYKFLKEDVHGEEGDLYVGFWKIKAQPSPLVTTWRVLEDKILTRANLPRGIRMDS